MKILAVIVGWLLDQWEAMAGSMDEAQRLKLMHAQDQYIVRCESSMPRY
jgi:hypothetical protein